jgi:hypothetical protein
MYVGLRQEVYTSSQEKQYIFIIYSSHFIQYSFMSTLIMNLANPPKVQFLISKYMSWKHCLWFGESIVFKVFDLWAMI